MNIVKDPVYFQLSKVLKKLINSTEYTENSQFLTEREIAKIYNVSRTTANKAVVSLVSEGILRLEKGIGTFVNRKEMTSDLHNLVSFTLKADSSNFLPSTKVLKLKKLSDIEISDNFKEYKIRDNYICYYMERLRYLNKTPVIFERRYLFLEENSIVNKPNLSGSLYKLLEDEFNITAAIVKQNIHSKNTDKDEARLLDIPFRSAGIEISAEAFNADSTVLWIEKTLYRGDKFEFTNYIKFPGQILSKGKFKDI